MTHQNNNNSSRKTKSLVSQKTLNPLLIKEKIDGIVWGNEDAKKVLSTLIYEHYANTIDKNKSLNNNKPKIILLLGESGTGKTLMASTISSIVNLPFICYDANKVTASGYVGDDVDDILIDLYNKSNEDITKAEHGIVFIDEICKRSSVQSNGMTTRDVSGSDVQKALLKMLEGSEVTFNPNGKGAYNKSEKVTLKTNNMLFILSGAFSGIDKIVGKRLGVSASSIGFVKNETSVNELSVGDLYKKVELSDVENYGFIREFVSRINIIVSTEMLTKELVLDLLLNSKNSPINVLVNKFQNLYQVKLKFERDVIDCIADDVLKSPYKVRHIEQFVNRFGVDLSFQISQLVLSQNDISSISIGLDYLENRLIENMKIDYVKKRTKKQKVRESGDDEVVASFAAVSS